MPFALRQDVEAGILPCNARFRAQKTKNPASQGEPGIAAAEAARDHLWLSDPRKTGPIRQREIAISLNGEAMPCGSSPPSRALDLEDTCLLISWRQRLKLRPWRSST